jgi:phosphofructokinase-like protein
MTERIAIVTGGGDCPGLNAVIRAVVKAAAYRGWESVGFLGGFEGMLEPVSTRPLDYNQMGGLLFRGGTILGTSNRGHFTAKTGYGDVRRIPEEILGEARRNFDALGLRALVAIGGDGSLTIAQQLFETGVPVVGVPKTIDNDLDATLATFGFESAVSCAVDALDRLHSTAESHNRVMVLEVMGRYAGWIAVTAGLAGGADVILIPEIPYRIESVVNAVKRRTTSGTNFSIIAVAEGAQDVETNRRYLGMVARRKAAVSGSPERAAADAELAAFDADHTGHSLRLARQLEALTGLESRVSILGYVQRGGTPSPIDRVLAARLGNAGADLVAEGTFGVMVASEGEGTRTVPLELVGGRLKTVPLDHSLVATARNVGTCLGD